jgi:hypothetical protein
MDGAKIRLSDAEMELLLRADWILTKNRILQKSMQLLGIIQENYAHHLHQLSKSLPAELFAVAAKISKGENLRGLPYQVLDYPRLFERENVFAIRTLFWWGNFFSITLQLSGKYKVLFQKNILSNYSYLRANEYHCCISDDPWLHHFEKDNYIPLGEMDEDEFKDQISDRSTIKVAAKIELTQWDKSPEWLQEKFEGIVKMLLN